MNSEESVLREIIRKLRKRAAPVGPLHTFWDAIFDMEACLTGERAIVNKSISEWIIYGQEMLAEPETGYEKQLREMEAIIHAKTQA